MPASHSLALALLYSAGAHGIMTLNDFKSIEGDRQMGVGSLPVKLGVDGAAMTACVMMALPQVVVIAMLVHWQAPYHALGVLALLIAQGVLMVWFVKKPVDRALYYSGFGVPLFVAGMMVSAFALRTTAGGA
jgi:chlorophyll synthase